MLVQIPGTKFVRDTNSMALINKDTSGLEDYNTKRRMLSNQKQELNNVKLEIADIRSEMCEIKQLLLKLLEGSNG
jgi:hypothetical protein